MPAGDVQEALRRVFERWGLPEHIRVDNGAPWATWSDLPPALALWWVGLGVEPIYNHPYRPQENPFVERSNGLVDAWAEPERCANLQEFVQHVAWMAQVQRERYPAIDGKSRLEAYPALGRKRHDYTRASEPQLWRLERVGAYLAEGRWPRLVSKIGQVTLYGQPYGIGHKHAGKQVWVRLDAQTYEWVVLAAEGEELARRKAEQLTAEAICQLRVAHPRPPSRRARRSSSNLAAHP